MRVFPNPGSAVAARVSRHVLPTFGHGELIEYGVKIPTHAKNVRFSQDNGWSSGDNTSMSSNVELMDLEPILKGSGDDLKSLAADIAWILKGSGALKQCDALKLTPIYPSL